MSSGWIQILCMLTSSFLTSLVLIIKWLILLFAWFLLNCMYMYYILITWLVYVRIWEEESEQIHIYDKRNNTQCQYSDSNVLLCISVLYSMSTLSCEQAVNTKKSNIWLFCWVLGIFEQKTVLYSSKKKISVHCC